MKNNFVVVGERGFLTVSGQWTEEYPEARIFHTEAEARRAARAHESWAVQDYGLESEEELEG